VAFALLYKCVALAVGERLTMCGAKGRLLAIHVVEEIVGPSLAVHVLYEC
jgi:hypothetical protein